MWGQYCKPKIWEITLCLKWPKLKASCHLSSLPRQLSISVQEQTCVLELSVLLQQQTSELMDCLCQWLRSATGKSYKTALTARYDPTERPALRTGILCLFLCSSVRLCLGKQFLIPKTRTVRCVQVCHKFPFMLTNGGHSWKWLGQLVYVAHFLLLFYPYSITGVWATLPGWHDGQRHQSGREDAVPPLQPRDFSTLTQTWGPSGTSALISSLHCRTQAGI